MAHLFVVAGHGDGDPGSGSYDGKYWEADLVRVLARRIKELGGDQVTLADTGRNFFKDSLWETYPLDTSWQAVELHMDAHDNMYARGGHVIVYSTEAADDYDLELADFISGMFPGRGEKLKAHPEFKCPRQAWNRGISYRLVEHCFITYNSDRTKFMESIDEIALGYLKIFGIEPVEVVADAETEDADTTEDTMKVMTADDGTRWLLTADGIMHPILTDEEFWTCEGFVKKSPTGDTFRRASADVLARVVARTA